MASSKAYQTVIAGRVREDEMPFFRLNKVGLPGGVFSTTNKGGVSSLPKFKKEYLRTEFVGKIRSTYVADTEVLSYNSYKG